MAPTSRLVSSALRSARPLSRSLHTTASRLAVPAAASAPSTSTSASPASAKPAPRVYVRKTAVPTARAVSARAAPSTIPSSTPSSAPTPTATSSNATRPVSATHKIVDEYAYVDLETYTDPLGEIEDYAHLAPPAYSRSTHRAPSSSGSSHLNIEGPTPTASPPLTSLPSKGYTPLPDATTQRSPGISGEVSAPAGNDWSTSFQGLSERPFGKEVAEALLKPLDPEDVEVKPDGLLYLPEIKYRRTLNAAFGPGGWGLAPRGETNVGPRIVSREWGLVCLGRLVSIARGEQEYFDPSGIPTATEACKSNALMRCCKDLGIASELWDPRFIREFKEKYCVEAMVEHVTQKKKRKLWRKKSAKFDYPYKELK